MDKIIGKIANQKFDRLSNSFSNAMILRDLVKRVFLRKSVITCLQKYEREDLGINWWQDKDLMSIFRNMYHAGVLPLPYDGVQRIRWIALICVSVCVRENFSYGNILYSLDYIPTDELTDEFGVGITEDIVKLRSELAKNGWEYVFKWNGGK